MASCMKPHVFSHSDKIYFCEIIETEEMWASPVTVEASCGSRIHSLDWKESTDQRGGWLALTGSESTVGVSWIGNRDQESEEEEKGAEATRAGVDNIACTEETCLFKSHFNLRRHSGEVKLVRWMPSGECLASYDSWGKITVWRNRANIMAHDFSITTGTLVTDMQWSPCGYYIIICGKEGSIQILSSTSGLIFFSIQVCSLGSLSFTAQFSVCSWNKPGHKVALGTQNGEFVMIIDPLSNSRSLSTLTLRKGIAVCSIEWFGPTITSQSRDGTSYQSQKMTAYLTNGEVIFFTDSSPPVCMSVRSGITDGAAKWSSKSLILAVVGSGRTPSEPAVIFVNTKGEITFSVEYDQALQSPSLPITNITWALEDSTLFFTKGSNLLKMRVEYCIPSLQSLCREAIVFSTEKRYQSASSTQHSGIMEALPLPVNEIDQLVSMRAPLIPVPLDVHGPGSLKALFEPLPNNQRLHCKMDTTHQESACTGYVVKFEYLNQYIAILEATRKPRSAGKLLSTGYLIRPAFECSPQASESHSKSKLLEPRPIGPHVCSQTKASQSSPSRTRTILKQLCSVLRSGRRQTVMDISEGATPPALFPSSLHSSLAEVNGRTITNRYQFFSTLPQLQNGNLGTLNISTSYIAFKPRQIRLTLQPPDIAEPLCLESKIPGWNERHQTYELDFGGRVNRDSVKNFQIERNGQIVLQFGRIDDTSFCLDFQAPFSPVQALCVALSYLM